MYILSKEEKYLLELGLRQQIRISRENVAIAELCGDLEEYNEYKGQENKLSSLLTRITADKVRVQFTKVK